MGTDYLSLSDRALLAWTLNLIHRLSGLFIQFGIPTAVFDQLSEYGRVYEEALLAATDPVTRTKVTVQKKNDARDALKKFIRGMVKEYLANNHLVTNADRVLLGLPVHDDKPTPIDPPTDVPRGNADTSTHQRHFLSVESSASSKKGKPDKVHGFEVWSKVGGEPPADETEWTYVNTATRSPMRIDYPMADVGKTVYYRFRWVNNRNQPGPWCEGYIVAVIA
jgi:hypothetical protein